MRMRENDRWRGTFTPQETGRHQFAIEAWRDPFASWTSDVTKKLGAGQNVDVEIIEGMALVAHAQERAPALHAHWRALNDPENDEQERLAILLSADLIELMREHGPRAGVSRCEPVPLVVDRKRAAFSAWYELFPRSASNDPERHGTFDDVIARLPYVKDLGFDVLYFTPIHPIGRTNRKGRNNALVATADDLGSVYAIGAREGGHDAIHPQLGTMDDFDRLVRDAASTASRSRSTSPSNARPIIPGSGNIRNGSSTGPTARSSTPRIRRRSTRTSSTSSSTAMHTPMSGSRCATSSCSGLAWRAHLPRRQSAHQAAAVLGVDDRRGDGRASRRASSCRRPSRGRR